MRHIKYIIVIATLIASIVRPLPTNAVITLNNENNFEVSQANHDLVTRAVHLLAGDPRLANHPIRAYLYEPHLRAHIVFDEATARLEGSENGAMTIGNRIHFHHNKDMTYYMTLLAHEFIHVAMANEYVDHGNYNFLNPEDFAFRHLMEEAFGNAIESWVRLSYPDVIPTNRQTRNWQNQYFFSDMTEVMRNDFVVRHPNRSEEQINAMVAAEMLNVLMTFNTNYSSQEIPRALNILYMYGNKFLIPEYNAYRERGDALLRHQWNYLLSLMPASVQQALRDSNRTYDHYRMRFRSDVNSWASGASTPESTILYWLNYDYMSNARRGLNNRSAHQRYDFLRVWEEQNLNRVMREINPFFTPVDTSRHPDRIRQDNEYRRVFGFERGTGR